MRPIGMAAVGVGVLIPANAFFVLGENWMMPIYHVGTLASVYALGLLLGLISART